jgi:GAF domain-containing protein
MAGTDPLRESLAALSGFFVGGATVRDTLFRVTELAERAVPQSAMTGITMLVEGKPATAVFTNGEAPEIDSAQYKTGEGPCLEAFRSQQVVIIESTESDDRWPDFCVTAIEHGVRSMLSLPLAANGEAVGALNFYALSPAAFGDAEREAATGFATQAAIVLANAQAYWDARNLSEQLSEAMRSRATIEQAKGIIMSQSGVGPDAAFELLVRASQRENRKLRQIAEDLVRRASSGEVPPLPRGQVPRLD